MFCNQLGSKHKEPPPEGGWVRQPPSGGGSLWIEPSWLQNIEIIMYIIIFIYISRSGSISHRFGRVQVRIASRYV